MRKPQGPLVVGSPSLMQAMCAAHRREGRTVGFVPTMGALHQGHMALVDEARQRADFVVVSIFVNPLQFDGAADLSSYPNTLKEDVDACEAAGVDVVFSPPPDALYPAGFCSNISAGPLGKVLEGKSRAGHFDGVSTVCALFFSIVQPHFAVFGEKDFQQILVVKRMVRDFHFPIEIVAMPVFRDIDGLALSSRNIRLTKRDRAHAPCLFKALAEMQKSVLNGETRTRTLLQVAKTSLQNTPGFDLDYCIVIEPRTLQEIDIVTDGARLLLAGTFGSINNRVRLLDNGPLFLPRD